MSIQPHILSSVLVAEASLLVQRAISIALEPLNLTLISTKDYEETLGSLTKAQPQVVMIENSIAFANGYNGLKRLQQVVPQARIVLLCGRSAPFLQEHLVESSGYYILKKPFTTEELKACLRRLSFQLVEQVEQIPKKPAMDHQVLREPHKLQDQKNDKNLSFAATSGFRVTDTKPPFFNEVQNEANGNQSLKISEMTRQAIEDQVRDYCKMHLHEMVRQVVVEELEQLMSKKADLVDSRF